MKFSLWKPLAHILSYYLLKQILPGNLSIVFPYFFCCLVLVGYLGNINLYNYVAENWSNKYLTMFGHPIVIKCEDVLESFQPQREDGSTRKLKVNVVVHRLRGTNQSFSHYGRAIVI